MEKKPYYLQTKEEVLAELNSNEKIGLTNEEVKNRIKKIGRNVVALKEKNKALIAFIKQFKDILAIVLIAAGALAIGFKDYQTGSVLLLIVLINSIIGFIQEFQAEKIISKLSKLINPKTRVIRDGKETEVDSGDLVPGDIVIINEGDSITADMRVLQSNKLQVNSFSITGESNPQHKNANQLKEITEITGQTNMIFTGTTVAIGNGKGLVIATGMNSEFGKIAALSQETKEELSPLQDEINNLAKRTILLSMMVGAAMLIAGIYMMNMSTIEAVMFAIGLSASMVPEGLPAEVNTSLALGAKRLARQKAIVKKLSSVETLGATTFICSDKTGTITKNEMTVEKIWIPGQEFDVKGIGYEGIGKIIPNDNKNIDEKKNTTLHEFIECGFYSSNAKIGLPDETHPTFYVLGDPTEGAIIALAKKHGLDMNERDEKHPEISEIPFDSDRKMMTSVRNYKGEILAFSKGAGDVVLERSIKLAFAYHQIEKLNDYTTENTEKDLIFMGLIAIMDPPREGVTEAIDAAHEAHIKIVIITGDAQETAMAISNKIHLAQNKKIYSITGKELDQTDDNNLINILQNNESVIFSRVSPEQKLRIVGLLKIYKEVVAVTGDGVNDAPALKKAHIGISMGQIGTEVAKEASQIVLADDSFITLVSAIKEGRIIYANLKKTIIACFTSNFGELTAIILSLIGAGIWGLPFGLLAIQILLIDLLGEILPLMALTFDSPTTDVMKKKPRDIKKHVLNVKQILDIALSGVFMGATGYIGFFIFLKISGVDFANIDTESTLYHEATTITYAGILCSQWWNVQLRRRGNETIFNKYFFTNKKLWLSYLASLILVLIVIYTPFLQPYTKMGSLSALSWGLIIALSTAFMLIMEFKKLLQRKFAKADN
ncbi:MAG: ATPase, P-type (Transporting), HAD superfamily, subfamily IC [Candidatus Peregrinibacteria bacterium GW2011_GWA2_33_10]|nr:MAG: ATPase, P-type (Transporting), HAD superfamily, subfamily IC [Candidatus Peregrinibacteria bacterium GW2011_GWA2_33_10]